MTDLLDDVDVVALRGDATATEVESVEFDSRAVRPGSLFCCVPGTRTDGHLHAADAVRRGAVALLCEHDLDQPVTEVLVRPGTVRTAMAEIAAAFHGHPARALTTIGVTGTNGKTTVTHLVRAVLDHAGIPTGVVGTLDGVRTTPEAPILQATLADLRENGTKAVALEVSSHALTQHRVDAMTFDVAAFTNLSREHLDHHGSMEEYYRAKARLFEADRTDVAVVDTDDSWGRRLADELEGRRVVRVGRSDVDQLVFSLGATSFRWRGKRVTLPLQGAFNVDNALVAAGVALALGIDESTIAEGLETAAPVPGRMELVRSEAPFAVVVDYAHTPAGLETALAAARTLAGARTGDLRLRLRGRPRPREASGDGSRGVEGRGRRGGDLGQPALGGPAGDHRRGGGRDGRRRPAGRRGRPVRGDPVGRLGGESGGRGVARREGTRDHPDRR